MQNNVYGAYILKAGYNLLCETNGKFTTWSLKRDHSLSQWSPSWRQYGGSVGTKMARIPIVTSLSTQRRVGVYTYLNFD